MDTISNPIDIAHCYLGFALHEDFAGNWEAAVRNNCKAAALFWKAGDMKRWGDPVMMTVFLLNYKEQYQLGLELSRTVADIGEQCGDAQLMGWGMQGQGLGHFHTGQVDKALTCLEKAVVLLESVPDHYACGITQKDRAKCCLQQGDVHRALAMLQRTDTQFSEFGLKGHFAAFLRNTLAEAHLRAAEQAGSREGSLKREVVPACKAALKESRRFRWALPEAYRLQGTCLWLRGHFGAARRSWNLSLESAEKLGAVSDFKMTRLEMKKRMGADCPDLQRTEAVLQEMEDNLDLSDIHKMMQISGFERLGSREASNTYSLIQ